MPRSSKKLLKMPEQPKPVHKCVPSLLSGPIDVALVGCGGNGAQMLTKLARLDYALRETGHPGGLSVTVFDPDTITRANIGRQLFSPADVGLHKCVVLVNRINCYYGLDWVACPERFKGTIQGQMGSSRTMLSPQLLITCVDTARTRREIHKMFWNAEHQPVYWLDLGNKKSDGQVILGQFHGTSVGTAPSSALNTSNWNLRIILNAMRLPLVTEVFPELLNARLKEDNEPSCSLADALAKQSLFVNDHVTDWAMQLLDNLLRGGQITHCGAFVNLETGRVNPLSVPMPEAGKEDSKPEKAKVAA